jgi:hypothetical protein
MATTVVQPPSKCHNEVQALMFECYDYYASYTKQQVTTLKSHLICTTLSTFHMKTTHWEKKIHSTQEET